MKRILKMALLTEIITFSSLNASGLSNFKSISWDWIAIFILAVLFSLLVISILRDLKATKKRINQYFVKEKCKINSNHQYLNDINNTRIESSKKLKETMLNISKEDDATILRDLKKVYKTLFLTNAEEKVFLSIATNSDIGNAEIFKLKNLFNELSEYDIIHKSDIKTLKQTIVTNKEVVSDIVLLLSKLQTFEHNYSEPKFNIDLNEATNTLNIEVARDLTLNSNIEKVLNSNLTPYYNESVKKYYGIYLYLTKHLTNRINATLKINCDKEHYNVSVDIPVDIKYNIAEVVKPDLVLKEPKKALIVSEAETGNIVATYLKELNFNTTIEPIKELNKELPNFIDYDIALVYSKIFEPILTDYLKTIKTYTPLKIVAMVDNNNSLYPSKIVDEVVDLDNLKESVYPKVSKLFSSDMILKKSNSETLDGDNIKVKESNIRSSRKKGRVLVADDDITNLHILNYMFKKYNIDVTTATNGVDVLKIIDTQDFDLIILDSVMPQLDGYETIVKIRENPKFNATPIVIHTSFSIEKSSMDSIFKLGFDSYLPKPFNKNDLKSLVERYIPTYVEPSKESNYKKEKKLDKESLKEFVAIYGDSDRMLEKYIKERRYEQAHSLLKDLKDVAVKIDATKFINSLDKIDDNLKSKQEVDSSLIYNLSTNLKELKLNIMKQLSA